MLKNRDRPQGKGPKSVPLRASGMPASPRAKPLSSWPAADQYKTHAPPSHHADALSLHGVRMDGLADARRPCAHFNGQCNLANPVARVRADDAAARNQHALGDFFQYQYAHAVDHARGLGPEGRGPQTDPHGWRAVGADACGGLAAFGSRWKIHIMKIQLRESTIVLF